MAYFSPAPSRYRGDEILAVSSAAVTLANVPSGANFVIIRVVSNDVRMRGNDQVPTAGAGQLLKAGEIFEWPGKPEELSMLRFIRVSADATLDVAYYRV